VGPPTSLALQRLLEKYNPSVVELTEETKSVIDGVRTAISRADAKQLNIYVAQLAQLKDRLSLLLKANTDVDKPPGASEPD